MLKFTHKKPNAHSNVSSILKCFLYKPNTQISTQKLKAHSNICLIPFTYPIVKFRQKKQTQVMLIDKQHHLNIYEQSRGLIFTNSPMGHALRFLKILKTEN